MNKKLQQSLKTSLPWLIALLGLVLMIIGEFFNFFGSDKSLLFYSKEKFNHFLIEVGKVILVGGVASITLDSLKYLGIYNEELIKLLFDTRFLRNRKDLPTYWERVTKEMLLDKFPKINDDILSDVKDMYLPTSSIRYYENYWQHCIIEIVDKNKEIVEITQTTKYRVIPVDNEQPEPLNFTSRIAHGGNVKDASFKVVSAKVNGEDQPHDTKETHDNFFLYSEFSLNFVKSQYYDIETVIKKSYSLKNDCMMGFTGRALMHNLIVQYQLKGVKLDFYELGTINKFQTKTENDMLIVKEYVGLIYKNQGYVAHIKKK